MKKLLSVFATFGIVASSTTTVIACGTKKEDKNFKPEEPTKDITQIVRDFEQDVAKIWSEHYEKEAAGNLIGLEVMEEGNEFLNIILIQKFSKQENKDKFTIQNKQQLTSDVEKLFKVKLLKEKMNELKKLNKYKIILDEVDSVFEHVELVFNDNFKINSGEVVEGSYIGNVIIDYKIVVQYKGLVDAAISFYITHNVTHEFFENPHHGSKLVANEFVKYLNTQLAEVESPYEKVVVYFKIPTVSSSKLPIFVQTKTKANQPIVFVGYSAKDQKTYTVVDIMRNDYYPLKVGSFKVTVRLKNL